VIASKAFAGVYIAFIFFRRPTASPGAAGQQGRVEVADGFDASSLGYEESEVPDA